MSNPVKCLLYLHSLPVPKHGHVNTLLLSIACPFKTNLHPNNMHIFSKGCLFRNMSSQNMFLTEYLSACPLQDTYTVQCTSYANLNSIYCMFNICIRPKPSPQCVYIRIFSTPQCVHIRIFSTPHCVHIRIFSTPQCVHIRIFLTPQCVHICIFSTPQCVHICIFLTPQCVHIRIFSTPHCVHIRIFSTPHCAHIHNMLIPTICASQ